MDNDVDLIERTFADSLIPEEGKSIVFGLADWCSKTKSIRLSKFYDKQKLTELGFDKLSTITEIYFDEIRFLIKKSIELNDNLNWNDIITYIKEIDGFGILRAKILYFAVTGKELPSNILVGLLIYEELLKKGYILTYDTTGNTLIHRKNVELFFNDLKVNFSEDLKLVECIKYIRSSIGVVRDENGNPAYFTTRQSLFSELFILDLLKNKSDTKLGYCDESKLGWFTEGQRYAIVNTINSLDRIIAITGCGGTGKTTTIKEIVKNIDREYNVLILAPTGAASKRIYDETKDIHNLLTYKPCTLHYYISNKTILNRTECPDVIIFDESSMIDSHVLGELFYTLMNFNPNILNKLRLIFVGDFSQLPPVGIGSIFNDLIKHKKCPIYHLTEVMRTSDVDLLTTFDQIRNEKPIGNQIEKYMIDLNINVMGSVIEKIIDNLFLENKEWYKNTMFVSYRNSTVDFINALTYNKLISLGIIDKPLIFLGDPMKKGTMGDLDWKYKGAKIIFTKNDRTLNVVNGTIGFVEKFSFNKHDEPVALVNAIGVEDLVEVKLNYPHVKLAYAISVHKSQGSEINHVIYIHTNTIETKELVYTAVTRTKQKLNIISPNKKIIIKFKEKIRETIVGTFSEIESSDDYYILKNKDLSVKVYKKDVMGV